MSMQRIVGRWWLFAAAFLIITGVGLRIFPVHADSEPDWMQVSSPAITQTDVPVADNQAPSQQDNKSCQQQLFVVGPLGEAANDCMVQTAFGWVGSSGNVVPNDGSVAYKIKFASPAMSSPIPVPHQQVTLATTTSSNGNNVLYYRNILSGAQVSTDPLTHQQIYTVTKGPDGILGDKAGNALRQEDGVTFSSNGAWMVYDVPGVAFVRINMATLDVLPFAGSNAATNGYKPPVPSTAISNDGQYIAFASPSGSLDIYSASTCLAVPNPITRPARCKFRTFTTDLTAAISGYHHSTNVHFIANGVLGFTAIYDYVDASHYRVANYTISTYDTARSSLGYLGLGDSYASGEGAFDYEAGTDTSDNKCHTSTLSYPLLLGAQLFDSTKTIACSGATTDDIINTGVDYMGQATPWVRRGDRQNADDILANFLPGYVSQLEFVGAYHPQDVTVSIGGNDVGFSDLVKSCLGFGTCLPTAEDRREKAQEINSKFPRLVQTYTLLKQSIARGGKVYVIGYPYVAKPDGDCGNNVHLNANEVRMSEELVDLLDEDIQHAAAKAGVAYVDVRHAFDGHRLCEGTSPAVNGLTFGNDHVIIGNESYHPTAFGHYLLDQAILRQTDNFTENMPAPQSSIGPVALDTTVPFLQQPAANRPLRMLENQSDMTAPSIARGATLQIRLNGPAAALKPDTVYQVELHSLPTELGSITTDAGGSAVSQISIPKDVEPGMHTLHVYGQNLAGVPMDVYESLYITGDVNLDAAASGAAVDNRASRSVMNAVYMGMTNLFSSVSRMQILGFGTGAVLDTTSAAPKQVDAAATHVHATSMIAARHSYRNLLVLCCVSLAASIGGGMYICRRPRR
jgi:hypothetical protein